MLEMYAMTMNPILRSFAVAALMVALLPALPSYGDNTKTVDSGSLSRLSAAGMRHLLQFSPVGLVVLLMSWPAEALAHGFAVRYDLPLPLGFFLAGAGATVALSFLLLALFARSPARADRGPTYVVSPTIGRILSNHWVAGVLQSVSVALFLLVLATALFGDTNPFKNISTTMVWLIWWVGMMFVNTFIGDVWALINPWSALFAGAESVLRALKPGARLSLDRPYPVRLGVWPGVVLFLAFAWIEIISGEGEDVRKLGILIIAYSLLTWSGMIVFGRRTWLAHGEAFAVVFSTFARFAPLAFHVGGRGGGARCPHGVEIAEGENVGCAACFETAPLAERAVVLRPPGAGLLMRQPVSWSIAAMVLTLLGSVTVDGFIATPAWTALYENFTALAEWAPRMGSVFDFYTLATTLFLLFPLIFGAVFLGCCRLTATIAGGITTGEAARYFVLTVLPIAIAYHLAHYLVFFLLTGQYIIPAVSDPFGFGWDLFGTASFKPDIALIGARFAWYTGVIAIVAGHVIAVYLAHRMTVRLFSDRRRMLASQFPLLALMVAYTMLSLWIIAQPAVQ